MVLAGVRVDLPGCYLTNYSSLSWGLRSLILVQSEPLQYKQFLSNSLSSGSYEVCSLALCLSSLAGPIRDFDELTVLFGMTEVGPFCAIVFAWLLAFDGQSTRSRFS